MRVGTFALAHQFYPYCLVHSRRSVNIYWKNDCVWSVSVCAFVDVICPGTVTGTVIVICYGVTDVSYSLTIWESFKWCVWSMHLCAFWFHFIHVNWVSVVAPKKVFTEYPVCVRSPSKKRLPLPALALWDHLLEVRFKLGRSWRRQFPTVARRRRGREGQYWD